MLCPNCQQDLDGTHKFCPYCGASTSRPIATKSSKRFPFLIGILLIIIVGYFSTHFFEFMSEYEAKNITDVVEKQLLTIRDHKYTEAYYAYTSKEFRDSTSLSDFTNFVKENHVLNNNRSIKIDSISMKDNLSQVTATVTGDDETTLQADYTLVYKDNEWKVFILSVGNKKKPSLTLEKDVDITTLEGPINKHLEAIKNGDYDAAYEYTSRDFAQMVPKENYKKLVQKHPILTQYENVEYIKYKSTKDRSIISAILHGPEGALPVEYKMANEDGIWKIWLFSITQAPGDPDAPKNTQVITVPVEEHLKQLKEGEIDKAYEQTSSEFKKTTSLDQYKDFLTRYPAFTGNESFKSTKSSFAGNIGTVVIEIQSEAGQTVANYTLISENGIWKIQGVFITASPKKAKIMMAKEIADTSPETSPEALKFDLSKFTVVVQDQLKALKESDYSKAYQEFCSEGFKSETSQDEFNTFVKKFDPLSKNKSAENFTVTFDNNTPTLHGTLTSTTGEKDVVEYDLVKENEQWKIEAIRVIER
jgi:hypothetical protein